jgi:hypothetical protein
MQILVDFLLKTRLSRKDRGVPLFWPKGYGGYLNSYLRPTLPGSVSTRELADLLTIDLTEKMATLVNSGPGAQSREK